MSSCDSCSLAGRWWTFVRERFPPALHLPMIACFALANAAVAVRAAGVPFEGRAAGLSALVAVLFFFRLRCFDEIKDYRVDLQLRPNRPLARGLLGVAQVKRAIAVVLALELAAVLANGTGAVAMHAVAVLYSLLMYREFFVGAWLRPHLTTYAVTHTFVSVLIGFSTAAQVVGRPPWTLPVALIWLGVANWMLFNVFEFARKTFAAGEELAGADSYSRRFGPRGAALLCVSQVVVAVACVSRLPDGVLGWPFACSWPAWTSHAALAGLPLSAAVAYAVRPRPATARLYRGACGAYQFLFYAWLGWQAANG